MKISTIKLNNTTRTSIIIIGIIWLLNLITMVIINIFGNYTQYISFLSLLVCVLFTYVFVVSVKKTGIFSLGTLFLICLFVFNLGRVFLYIFGLFDYLNSSFNILSKFSWSSETALSVLNYYLLFLSIFLLFCSLSTNRKTKYRRIQNLYFPGKNQVLKIFRVLLIVSAPIMAFFFFREARVVIKLGYMSYYTGEASTAFNGGGLFSIIRLLFTVSFYMNCTLENDEKHFNRISIIYLLVIGIRLIQGSRAGFIVAVLTILYIRYRRFGKSINLVVVVLAMFLTIPGVYLIACLREGNITSFNLYESFRYFIVDLSGSLNVPAYYIQNATTLSNNNVPYFFDTIIRLFDVIKHPDIYAGGQSLDMIAVTSNLGHHITYNISPDYYLAGANVASNFIAELSEFGVCGILIGTIIFSKLIFYLDENFDNNLFFRFMSVEWIGKILFAPRGELFYDTYSLFKFGIIFFTIYLACKFIYERRI